MMAGRLRCAYLDALVVHYTLVRACHVRCFSTFQLTITVQYNAILTPTTYSIDWHCSRRIPS